VQKRWTPWLPGKKRPRIPTVEGICRIARIDYFRINLYEAVILFLHSLGRYLPGRGPATAWGDCRPKPINAYTELIATKRPLAATKSRPTPRGSESSAMTHVSLNADLDQNIDPEVAQRGRNLDA
jgi:hypothetical protein